MTYVAAMPADASRRLVVVRALVSITLLNSSMSYGKSHDRSKLDSARQIESGKLFGMTMTQSASPGLTDMAHNAISSVATKAKEGGEAVARTAKAATAEVDATTQYIRGHSTQEMVADFKQFVTRHPGASVVCAAVVGVLLGRGFSKR